MAASRLVYVVVFALLGLAQPSAGPDIVILNGRVFTGNRAEPWAEAVAVRGDRITAVGSSSDVRALSVDTTRVIDASGRLLIPGINDAHTHPGATPAHTRMEGLPAVEHDPTVDEVLTRLQAAVAKAPPGGWIFGEIGSTVLDDRRATRATFDGVSAGHPVLLTSWTGHGVIANTAALRALRVREDEPDPPGGRFARGADGRTLTGLAHEYADYLLWRRVAMLTDRAQQIDAFREIARELASYGGTSMQAMMTAYPAQHASELLTGIDLPVRIRLIDFPFGAMTDWRPASGRAGSASPLVTMSGTKWVLDGTPVERLMLLRAPYADDSTTRGAANFSDHDLRAFLQRVLAAREQPMLHAVGDGAIRAVLDALDATGGTRWKPLRPRIEHGDMFGTEEFERAKRMGVTIVQNPSHFMLRPIMDARLGPARVQQVTRVKDIVAASVPLALGSDGPLNPFLNIMFATVNANNPAQALTVHEALTAYTAGSAAAEFAEGEKGMLKTGMLADMALLSQDIFRVAPSDLPRTTSVLTMVNGRIVHDRMPR